MDLRRVGLALLVSACSVVWAPVPGSADIALAVDALPEADAPPIPAGGGDPLSCLERAAIPAIDHVTSIQWAPDGKRLALERIVTMPSAWTITGTEEEVRVLELDVDRGEARDLGEASHPQWSGTGQYLSRWRDGLRITRDGVQVARLEPSMPGLRWLGNTLMFWDLNEIKSWSPDGMRIISTVDPAFVPSYPTDDVAFSADGTLFTLTRYRMDGSAERWVGETRTGQLAPLQSEGTVYTEWAPTGATLLARSAGHIELRGEGGWRRSAPLTAFPGPVHGWAPDGKRLLLGAIAPTVPAGTSVDRFDVWDGDAVVAKAHLPNVLGTRSFSPDGRFFAGTQRTGLYGSELAVFACGTTATQRADPSARSRQDRIADDTRRFVRPVAGAISQFLQGAHTGIDIAAPVGATITAADDGVVTMVGWHQYGGRTVCVQHAGGLESCYYHTSIAYVAPGEQVARGQPVAAIGLTGLTTGPHLHWEVKRDGVIVDPLKH